MNIINDMINKSVYISILQYLKTDACLFLDEKDKQKGFEAYLCYQPSYSNFDLIKLENLNLSLIYSLFRSITWSNYAGKNYFKNFFKIIYIDFFVNDIMIPFYTKIRFLKIENKLFLVNFLYRILVKYCSQNFLNFDQIFLEKISFFFIEVFFLENIFIYDFIAKIYIINPSFNLFDIEHLCTIVQYPWPLIIPANNYTLINDTYLGGYYQEVNLLSLFKDENKCLNISKVNLDFISKLQNQKYSLMHNSNIIQFIILYFRNLTNRLNNLHLSGKLNSYLHLLHQYYTIYQYLVFVESKFSEIYFPVQIDSYGQIHYVVEFGLTLKTTDTLSRYLVGFGKSFLIDIKKQEHERFILDSINMDLVKANKLKIESLYDLDVKFILFEDNFNVFSIENLVLLADWYYNILPYNYTEITLEFNFVAPNYSIYK